MAALYEDRTGSRARDDASGLHHGVQALGCGIDAGQDTCLGNVGSHDLRQAEQLVHHGPRRPVGHERRPARGDHDRVNNDAVCLMAAQALCNRAGDPSARKHADLDGGGTDVLKHGVYLVGHNLRVCLLYGANPAGVLCRERTNHALAIQAQGGNGLKVGLNAGATRRVAAGDSENGRKLHGSSNTGKTACPERVEHRRTSRTGRTRAIATQANEKLLSNSLERLVVRPGRDCRGKVAGSLTRVGCGKDGRDHCHTRCARRAKGSDVALVDAADGDNRQRRGRHNPSEACQTHVLRIPLGRRGVDRASQVVGTGLVGGQRLGGVVGAHANDRVGPQHLPSLGAGEVRLAHMDTVGPHLKRALDVIVHHEGNVVSTAHGKHLAGKFAATLVTDVLLAQLHKRRPAQDCLLNDIAKASPIEPTRVGYGINRKAATQGVSICGAFTIGRGPLRGGHRWRLAPPCRRSS